jgi:hypothetical protein
MNPAWAKDFYIDYTNDYCHVTNYNLQLSLRDMLGCVPSLGATA